VTVYEKTRHMGFFMKIAIVPPVVLVTSELAAVQILERSPASFFGYDAFFLDHSGTFILRKYDLNALLCTVT
jgi:hypothetical protein